MTFGASRYIRLAVTCLVLSPGLATGATSQQAPTSWVIGGGVGEPWSGAMARSIAVDDTSHPGALLPQEVPAGHSVVRQVVRSGLATMQRNLFDYRWTLTKGPRLLEADTLSIGWHPRMWQSGGANVNASPIMLGLVDGDVLTSGFTHKAKADGRPNAVTFFTLDLGVPVPVDSIVFFPPQSGLTSDNERQRELYPRAYEVSRTNTPVEWLIFEDESISTGSSGYHPLEEILGTTFANNNSIVSLTSDLRFTRFLRFKFGEVTTTTMVAEIEVYGRGFPSEARYLSQPHAFGGPVSLGRVTWRFTRFRQAPSGEVFEDPTAPVEFVLRTRAGLDPEPKTFYIFDELGRQLEVDEETYFAAPRILESLTEGIAGFRASRGDDTESWNNWSVAYSSSGDEVRSSDGRQYLQFAFEITTEDPLAFGVLDSLAFEVSPLLADSVLGEISLDGADAFQAGPIEVPLGVDTLFTYDIRSVYGSGAWAGFDGIELDVPSAARFIDLEIDGAPAVEGIDYYLDTADRRLRLLFPEPFLRDALFRVRFRSAIYQPSVFLEGRVFSRDPAVAGLPQSIEGGDARPDVASNDIQVVIGELRLRVLGKVQLSSSVLSPNGDGINDETAVAFSLFGVEGAALRVEVCDLTGRRLAVLLNASASAGPFEPSWRGLDEAGNLVAPGLYLVRVEVDVDEGTMVAIEPVAVAY